MPGTPTSPERARKPDLPSLRLTAERGDVFEFLLTDEDELLGHKTPGELRSAILDLEPRDPTARMGNIQTLAGITVPARDGRHHRLQLLREEDRGDRAEAMVHDWQLHPVTSDVDSASGVVFLSLIPQEATTVAHFEARNFASAEEAMAAATTTYGLVSRRIPA